MKETKETIVVVNDETAELRAKIDGLTAQVQALLQMQTSSGGISAAQLKEVMLEVTKVQGDAFLAAQKQIAERDMRDDLNYPKISAYSYPEGDKARPRPPLKCRMFQNGADIEWDTSTAEEIEYLNQYTLGEYIFRRIDGRTPETLTVGGEMSPSGKISKLEFTFKSKEGRDTLPTWASMLRDGLGLQTKEQQEIARLKAELAAVATKAVA